LNPPKATNHDVLQDDQKDLLRLLQRRSNDASMFIYDIEEIRQIERTKPTIISQIDMDTLKRLRQEEIDKKKEKDLGKDVQDDTDDEQKK